MKEERESKAIVLRTSYEGEIVIRPQREGEQAFLNARRLVVLTSLQGPWILTVRKVGPIEATLALLFYPEKRWKRCPNCQKTDWSAWLPVQLSHREIAPDGNVRHEYPYVQWFVMCIHCVSIADIRSSGPYAKDEGEYLYNPAEKTMLTLPSLQEKKKVKR